MFETSKPFPSAFRGDDSVGAELSASPATSAMPSQGRGALRAIEWHELAARLNAARELRRELRQEASLCAGTSHATFEDAAATFFGALGNGERPVNPDTLEGCKSSCDSSQEIPGSTARSDARDNV